MYQCWQSSSFVDMLAEWFCFGDGSTNGHIMIKRHQLLKTVGLSPFYFGDALVWNYVLLAWDYLAVLMLY